MKHSFSFAAIIFVSIVAVLGSCTNAPEKAETTAALAIFNIDSVKEAIIASNKLYGESFVTGDSAKFVSSYTSDACLYVSNTPKMCGPQAITAFFNGSYQMGARNLKLTTEEVTGGKEAVVETGNYELYANKDQLIDKGKYIVIWKEENGKWKMHRDIWNTDMPGAPPAAKK